jgi:effector-binding domain-containing protein
MREYLKRPPLVPVICAALIGLWLLAPFAQAQTATPSASPAPAIVPTPSPSVAAAPTPTPIAPPSVALPQSTPSPMTTEDQTVGSNGETITLATRPAATLDGKANRDDIFGAIVGGIKIVRAEMDKAGLKPAGRPMAVFLSATDEDFRYRVEIPIDAAPAGKTELSQAVKIGQTPVGKAMRFEHRGAYDDIDSTYDAITAYVDEKGVDAQDVFIEEYITDLNAPDDPNTVVNIEVLLN